MNEFRQDNSKNGGKFNFAFWGKVFIAMTLFAIAMYGEFGKPRCAKPSCNRRVREWSSAFCSKHAPGSSRSNSSYSYSTYSSGSKTSTGTSSSGSTSNRTGISQSGSYSSSGTKTGSGNSASTSAKKPTRMYDPYDYDSPEDFADDAWGVDFDDWDDAYDYWENY